jgi:hypothetical protein
LYYNTMRYLAYGWEESMNDYFNNLDVIEKNLKYLTEYHCEMRA